MHINMKEIFLTPAYGRKYNSKVSMLKDWEGGLDFKIYTGPYTSIRDKESLLEDFDRVYIMYGNELQYIYEVT